MARTVRSGVLPELNPAVAGTHLPMGPTAYLSLVTRPAETHQVNEAQLRSCCCCCLPTSCVVFVVVYNVWDGHEGVFLSQVELTRVRYFNLVMSDISVRTAQIKQKNVCCVAGKYFLFIGVFYFGFTLMSWCKQKRYKLLSDWTPELQNHLLYPENNKNK